MIKYQFSPMPSGKACREGRESRKRQAVWQNLFRKIEPQAGIGASNGEEDHSSDSVVPACNAHPNPGDREKLKRSRDSGEKTESKGNAGRPATDLKPERISGPPVENIHTERAGNEGNREMHHHCVDRMTGDSNGRIDVLLSDGADGGVGMVRGNLRWRTFFLRNFLALRIGTLGHLSALSPKALMLVATCLMVSGCSGDLSALDPAGPRASNLATLWWVMLIGAVVLFALVATLLLLTYLRPSLLRRITPTQWIVGGGLVLPVPILLLLTGTALVLGEQLLPTGGTPRSVEATAQRWAWEFRHPGGHVSSTLYLPAGEPVDIIVTSADVIHSLWLPRLGGKIDAIPGRQNVVRLEADEPGTYWGICAEYCGIGHDTMFFQVEALTQPDYDALTKGNQP